MKILMALMGLEIGGAETHVVELSKELSRMGHDITVASSGGVYEKEITDFGITHVTLPLGSKSPLSLLTSYSGLKKLIKREKFDIIHAHARIPAFICGRLARKMGFKFITTTHFDFKVTSLYRKTSDWGEYQLAVSHDLKNYLVKNYGANPDNISVTINGIDTEKFTSTRNIDALIGKIGLNEGKKRVLYVGRIDEEVAEAALLLAENAHFIAKRVPGTQVIIVGGGSAFDKLSELADKSNILAGYECVKLMGPRTDIADFTALCNVFVGVSRAALEAMAAKRPTVLAGAQGYMGIFSADKLETAISNNFTCRGEAKTTGELIVNDVCKLLEASDTELEAIGEYNHSVVKKHYSVSRMALDHLAVYENAGARLDEKAEIIISGYYGFGNLGDDTLLRSLIASLRREKPDVKITVLCAKPSKMRSLYGARCINRYNLPAIISEMRHASILINGGGNLIQDGTSKKSLLYYTSIMRLARKMGLKTVLYANGIGPLYNDISRKRAKLAIEECELITLRDPESLELIRELGCHSAANNAKISADPAFAGLDSDKKWIDFILKREGLEIGEKYFMVSVRSGNTLADDKVSYDERVVTNLSRAINSIIDKYGFTPIFVPFQSKIDDAITAKLASICKCGITLSGLSATELCGVIDVCEFTLSMRLHLLIFAASRSVPMVGISYDKKVDSFMKYIDLDAACDVRYFEPSDIVNAVVNIVENRDKLVKKLSDKKLEFNKLTNDDAKAVIAML